MPPGMLLHEGVADRVRILREGRVMPVSFRRGPSRVCRLRLQNRGPGEAGTKASRGENPPAGPEAERLQATARSDTEQARFPRIGPPVSLSETDEPKYE